MMQKQAIELKEGILFLIKNSPVRSRIFSPSGQPFDTHLLHLSSLYRTSRRLYLKNNGQFLPSLVSSPRTLSSASLLRNLIEYSPIENELIWAAKNPSQSRQPKYLLTLRSYISNLFHEQNHRILWTFLPPPSKKTKTLHRYLNFVESLVIILDMALGDELGPKLAPLFHLCGAAYDPGTKIKQQLETRRTYRNYLQAALYGTYLNLEMYDEADIIKIIQALFPSLGDLALRAVQRSVRLDREFVQKTNPIWQSLHSKEVLQTFCSQINQGNAQLELPEDPFNNYLIYLWTEKWLDHFNL